MVFEAEYISDTHLNLWKYKPAQILPIFPGLTPTLILAGDIGDPDEPTLYQTLDLVRSKYKRVLYIPGNHEFYAREPGSKKSPQQVISWFDRLDQQWDTFHLFYRRQEVYDGVRVIGATGWSTAPKDTAWANMISEEGRMDREFISQALAKSKEKCLVVTHYPSTLRVLQDNFRNKPGQFDYAQDLEYLYHPPVHTWIFGHVHQRHEINIPYASSLRGNGTVRVLCNPYGYPHEGITCPKAAMLTIEPR
jgi:predicted phosphohydrolase